MGYLATSSVARDRGSIDSPAYETADALSAHFQPEGAQPAG